MNRQAARVTVPKHPLEPAIVVYAVIGAGGVIAGFMVFRFSVAASLGVTTLAFALLGFALHVRRVARPTQHVNAAVNALSAGRVELAEAHLAEAEGCRAPLIRIASSLSRAQIALRSGELSLSREHLDAALAVGLPLIARLHARFMRASALGVRAFVHALHKDAERAQADLRELESGSSLPVDAPVWVALTRAVLLRHAADARGLAEHLKRHQTLLLEHTRPRERALVRALRWSLRHPTTAYRTAARPGAGAAGSDLEQWLETVLPGAGALLRETPFVAELSETAEGAAAAVAPRAQHEAPAPRAAAGAQTAVEVPPPLVPVSIARAAAPRRARQGLKLLALWAVLVFAFLAIWQLTDSAAPEREVAVDTEKRDGALPTMLIVMPALVPLLIGAMLFVANREQRRLVAAGRLMTSGDEAGAQQQLSLLTRSSYRQIGAQAHVLLAALAERNAEFDVALAHSDAALARLDVPGARAASHELTLPEIHATRALALAALDRRPEAASELALLKRNFPTFALLDRAVLRVEQILAVRLGDYASCARLASTRSADLPVSFRDDVLGEIAATVVRGGDPGRDRLERLRSEIDGIPALSRWLSVVAPDLLRRFGELKTA